MSDKKYYPLKVLDLMMKVSVPVSPTDPHNVRIEEHSAETLLYDWKCRGLFAQDATVNELYNYAFGRKFFSEEYNGKFKNFNKFARTNKRFNELICPNVPMDDYDKRCTEWKDMLTITLALDLWSKSKMVYKIDNDFFHEIKNTENLCVTSDIYDKLPYYCFFIDLTEVDRILDFKGAWVVVVKDKNTGSVGINIYMVKGEACPTFFSYYSWIDFNGNESAELKTEDIPKSPFIIRNAGLEPGDNELTAIENIRDGNREPYVSAGDKDPRHEIVIAALQIMQFIAMDASDVSENENTKRTYKKSDAVRNKYSEIRMWDVGVRYGKAIRIAKQEYKKHIERERSGEEQGEHKDRKPTRPHIRRAHWHKYLIGKGRQESKIVWLAPIYVCGDGKEIPVTIHEIKK